MKKALALVLFCCLMLLGYASQAETAAPEATPTPRATESSSLSCANVPAPTPEAVPSPTPVPTPFTLVWISDTQNICREKSPVFDSMRDWILENREKENIQFVVHTGDVIDGFSPTMFENAANAMVPIFQALPGMIVSGNHDISKNGSQYYFVQRPYTQLVQKKGQTYRDGDAAYATFHAGGADFLVFGLGYEVKCTDWMNEVIAQHPNHVVIAVIHKGLEKKGVFFVDARNIFQQVVPKCPTFRLLLCGHMRGTITQTDWFDDDGDGTPERSFTSMMFNYQDDTLNGLGFMRLLKFDPLTRNIEISTYSPWLDLWHYVRAEESDDHFILENAW